MTSDREDGPDMRPEQPRLSAFCHEMIRLAESLRDGFVAVCYLPYEGWNIWLVLSPENWWTLSVYIHPPGRAATHQDWYVLGQVTTVLARRALFGELEGPLPQPSSSGQLAWSWHECERAEASRGDPKESP